jgi:hypothetical protein
MEAGSMASRWCAVGLSCAVALCSALRAQEPPSGQARAARLVLEHNGVPITDWVILKPSDSLALTIKAVDALGNAVPISGFEIWVWDPKVLGVMGQDVGQSEAVVRFQSRSRGQTTIQIRASGVRQWVLVHLTETVLSISPGQVVAPGVAPNRIGWTAGGRVSAGLYSYSFNNNTVFDGQYGVVFEGYGGMEFPSGLELVAGMGFGILGADSSGTLVKPKMIEGYVRADYPLMPLRKVRPVLSAGVGIYQIRTGSSGAGIWNASFQFLAGGGVDITVGPTTVAELRLSTQQLFEMTSSHANGYVGSLWLLGAEIRARF